MVWALIRLMHWNLTVLLEKKYGLRISTAEEGKKVLYSVKVDGRVYYSQRESMNYLFHASFALRKTRN